MKKVIISISDTTYEKLCLEAIEKKKDVPTLLRERMMYQRFSDDVEECFEKKMALDLQKLLEEN